MDGSEPPEAPSAVVHWLPAAVIATILSDLDIRSLASAASTCRSFRAVAKQTLSFLPSFHLLDFALSLEFLRPLLPDNPHIQSLRLDCARLDDTAIPLLTKSSLRELYLHNCDNLSGRLLAELGAKCRDLRTLSVSSLAERRKSLCFWDLKSFLNGCSQLESLSLALDFSAFDNPTFRDVWVGASRGLYSLEIGYIPLSMLLELLSVTADSPQPPLKFSTIFLSLQKLCLSVDYITDELVGSISNTLPSLTHLDLQDAPIIEPLSPADLTNTGLQQINLHGKLKHLSLVRSREFLFTCFRRVNDLGILLMTGTCSKLESITLGGFSRVTDTGFRAIIHACSNLRKLRVSQGYHLTDLVFHDILATSLSLTHVSLRWCNLLTDVGVERLSLNKDLTVIDLRDCRNLGDNSLRAISSLANLQVLLLDGTAITDVGVSYLGCGKCLPVSLTLRNCRKLTDQVVPSLFSGAIKFSLQILDLSLIHNLSDEAILLLARSRVPIIELLLRECEQIGDASVMALASMHLDNSGTHGSSLQLLDLYDCGRITPLAFRWFKKPYFPRLRCLGITGSLNRDMVDALARIRPFLHIACRGEELGTSSYYNDSSDWYRLDEDDDIYEQWLLGGDGALHDDFMEEQ